MNKVDDTYARMKTAIRMGDLAPGHQASEPELAGAFGVSRATVREALIRLKGDGIVELIPRRGARVLPLKVSDLQDIYEILTLVEPHVAAELAARKLDSTALAPLELALNDMQAALDAGDLETWAEADDRFHFGLLELHGNSRLADFVATLYDQAHRARMVTLRIRALPRQSLEEHRQIFEAICAGDPDAAMTVFREHRHRAAEELVSVLKDTGIRQI